MSPARTENRSRHGMQIMRRLALATVTVLLGSCGGAGGVDSAPAAATPLVAPGVWVVLGSSTAAGIGASRSSAAWTALLADQAAPRLVTLVNLARAGTVTHQALPAATAPAAGRPAPDAAINIDRALASAPKLVILAFPSNDAVAGYGADETVANLLRMRDTAKGQAAAALLLSSQPRDGLTAAQRATIADVDLRGAAAFGLCFVDVRTDLAAADGSIAAAYAAGDGVHLNDAGHRRIAERVWALLEGGRCVRLTGTP